MKRIVIAAEDARGLDGEVSAHFGRCPYYVCVDVDPTADEDFLGEVKVVENEYFNRHQPGIMPKFIKGLGAEVIIAGGMGPRAIDLFHAMDVEVATGALGVVGQVVQAYLMGDIRGIVPCAHDHPESCGGHNDRPQKGGHHDV